jgi:hypothetical protein
MKARHHDSPKQKMLHNLQHRSLYRIQQFKTSMPTGFFIWGYMYPFTIIFGGAMYPLTLHLGEQRKLTAFSPRKVVYHAVFCKYYAELANFFFFCLTLSQTGSGVLSDPWPLCLSHHFFVILYITCQILFFIQN